MSGKKGTKAKIKRRKFLEQSGIEASELLTEKQLEEADAKFNIKHLKNAKFNDEGK